MKDIKEILADKHNVNIAIIAAASLSYMLIFFIPQAKELVTTLSEAAKLKREIVETKQKWADISSAENQVLLLKEKIRDYEKKLPMEKEISSILQYLSDAAKKLDVTINEIKPGEQTTKQDKKALYWSIPIVVKAKCGYHQLGAFLNELEKADRFMKITDIEITATPYADTAHEVELTVVTYVMSLKI